MNKSYKKLLHLYSRAGFGVNRKRADELLQKKDFVSPLLDFSELKPIEVDIPPMEEMPSYSDMKMMSKDERQEMRKMSVKNTQKVLLNWIDQMQKGECDLAEKMALFWHGHFACRIRNPYIAIQYTDTLRMHGVITSYSIHYTKLYDVLEKLDISKEWKKLKKNQPAVLPIYKFMSKDGNSVDSYILPMYGYGLWNDIWGYFALESDKKTVKGVVFSHKGETPGLGARIGDKEVQDRYIGKKIFVNGELKPTFMVKGEGKTGLPDYEVDGLSGATLTAIGLNEMVDRYLNQYKPFLEKGASAVSMAQ